MSKQTIGPGGGQIDAVTPDELAAALAERRTNVVFGLGGGKTERMNEDSPMKGTLRQITSYNRGQGNDNFVLAANTLTKLCDHNPTRIAGNIQNIGANPVFLYLGEGNNVIPGANGSVFTGYLAAGGSFDFKLTNDCWCGPVWLYSVLGTTLVWGEH